MNNIIHKKRAQRIRKKLKKINKKDLDYLYLDLLEIYQHKLLMIKIIKL